jgi:hypothetical protein
MSALWINQKLATPYFPSRPNSYLREPKIGVCALSGCITKLICYGINSDVLIKNYY